MMNTQFSNGTHTCGTYTTGTVNKDGYVKGWSVSDGCRGFSHNVFSGFSVKTLNNRTENELAQSRLWHHSYLSDPTIAEMVRHLRERGLRNFAVEEGLITLF
jgi:hypothetical protein